MMHWIDILIFSLYIVFMLGIGWYFYKRNKDTEDFYVGGRSMKSVHLGLSVVATDVGGGFSIGLGGLGFMMGISGSWMLITGLIGAWVTAVLLIPRVHHMGSKFNFVSFPEFLLKAYGKRVAFIAGIITAIGYLGFTSSQILAGAKLASATFTQLSTFQALIIMGVVAVIYTSIGGLKAVIYTDTVQWIILMTGLIFIGIPMCYFAVGGKESIMNTLPKEFFSFANISWQNIVYWFVTIIPIWFIAMTLYQRIYAAKNKKEAKRAWFMAGLFEYPIMAFMGVLLGMFARVAYENGMLTVLGYSPGTGIDQEKALPLLLSSVLPVGLMGLMMSAYFSAIMSTADSCLMASSGTVTIDILKIGNKNKYTLLYSQIITFITGTVAIFIAVKIPNVLNLMMYSYAFMVSGLFAPVIGILFLKRRSSLAAFWSMIIGGSTTVILAFLKIHLPFDLDPNVFGLTVSLLIMIILPFIIRRT